MKNRRKNSLPRCRGEKGARRATGWRGRWALPGLIGLLLAGCSVVPPASPVAEAPLPDGNHLDAGIYFNYGDQRLHARQFYVDRYAWLVKTYGPKTVPPVTDATRGLTKLPSGEYLVTIEVTTNFERLNRRSKIAP